MNRILPRSLFGQTLLILLAGLIVSQLVGAWILAGAREEAVRAVGALGLAQRVANLARLVEETPAEGRSRIVAALSDPTFRVTLSASAPTLPASSSSDAASAIRDFLASGLPTQPGRRIEVAVSDAAGPAFAPFNHPMPMAPMMAAFGMARDFAAAIELSDGNWLSFATSLPSAGPPISWQFILSLAIMAVIVLAVSAWAVRRVTAPLGLIADAAERLGKDLGSEPLPEIGTAEMQGAARAFNRMQEQLRRLIDNRTRMLAAVSHDLRTPLTLLRLRTESVADAQERAKMVATIGEMDAMIEATLRFAKDEASAEPRRRTDVSALVESIVDDMADAGLPVAIGVAEPVVCECQPGALKRAIVNLVDNAVKYGKRAEVSVGADGKAARIAVKDDGPGIPEAELGQVLEPFYRVEQSRSRDTGGIGLGLTIASAIAEAHGGRLWLANRPEGGLIASLELPI